MSGRRRSGMAGRARGRVAAGAVLSRGVHPAGSAGRWVLTRRKALGLMSATLLPVSGGAVSLVPPVVPGQAPRRLSGRCAAVLRQACPTDRSASIRRLSGAVVEHKLGGLLQAPLRGTEGSVALSRPLPPPGRHL